MTQYNYSRIGQEVVDGWGKETEEDLDDVIRSLSTQDTHLAVAVYTVHVLRQIQVEIALLTEEPKRIARELRVVQQEERRGEMRPIWDLLRKKIQVLPPNVKDKIFSGLHDFWFDYVYCGQDWGRKQIQKYHKKPLKKWNEKNLNYLRGVGALTITRFFEDEHTGDRE